jgi:DNA-binding transcriptional MerR regulator/effector-binding domain-containing protein
MYTIGEFASIGRISVRMLRHYDAIGLLTPARVDPANGYRYYANHQFTDLLTIGAYKDLGLRLDQITAILAGSTTSTELRELLVQRRKQLSGDVAAAQAQLGRIEARLRHLEGAPDMSVPTVTLKSAPAVRVAELSADVPELDPSNIAPVIGPLFGRLGGLLAQHHIAPTGPPLAVYTFADGDEPAASMHAAFPVAPEVGPHLGFDLVDYPAVPEFAALTHYGSMDTISDSWRALGTWITTAGLHPRAGCRELYLVTEPIDDQSGWVTELQWPVERGEN